MLSTAAYATAAYKLCDLATSIKAKYGQVIQYLDLGGGFASANTLKMEGTRKKTNKYFASLVGKEIAQKALDKNINSVVFDRGYRQFNAEGKLGAFVNSARNAGLCI